MEYLGNIIVVTVEDLTRSDDGDAVMTSANYKQLAHRGKFNIIRQGKGLGHPALIEWSSLPERFKAKLRAKYGDPETVLNRGNDMLKIDEAARSFFADYRLPDGSALKSDHQMEYTINASVLTHMHNLKNIQKSRRAMSGNTTPVNWSAIISSCESMRDVYGHTLPKNEARLRAKLRQFEVEGYACLVSGKLNNGNSIKITEAAGRQIIAWKRSRIPVYTVNQIFEKFNAEAEGKGWKPLKSINTLVEFL
ncbi:MAG: kinase, partial [Bacteroidales bacterium]|nr:kinase [Bacteroidales bacterium]